MQDLVSAAERSFAGGENDKLKHVCFLFFFSTFEVKTVAKEKRKRKTKIFGPTQIRTEIKRSRVSYTNPYTMGPSHEKQIRIVSDIVIIMCFRSKLVFLVAV